ncbi:hypothetical protein Dda3937_04647 [Dickeya dadantii 3937]|uniref:Uncharacterized protein n=1 Tax=Dickeya dadantii (strain 3937) TaxID=198628 RepID=E0SJH1_DICD3|nr:hypothetical protein Dda3937_04647 [Dickeya dadantii 3937]
MLVTSNEFSARLPQLVFTPTSAPARLAIMADQSINIPCQTKCNQGGNNTTVYTPCRTGTDRDYNSRASTLY